MAITTTSSISMTFVVSLGSVLIFSAKVVVASRQDVMNKMFFSHIYCLVLFDTSRMTRVVTSFYQAENLYIPLCIIHDGE